MTMLFKRVAEHINVVPLLKKLEQHPELWGEITARQEAPGSPHKDTEAIFLRWCEQQDAYSVFQDLQAVDYPAASLLMPEVGHVLLALLTMLGETAELGRVMIVKLKPGGHITPHVDEGLYADFYDRFHVCLSGECEFTVAGQTFTCRPGEGWWFNHKRKHEVRNNGSTDRIHMIVDVAVPAYRALRGIYFQREFSRDLWPEIYAAARKALAGDCALPGCAVGA
jgi:quercetin dioxygenase-like cupin family protein